MEQFFVGVWNRWLNRGGVCEAQPLRDGEGCVLRLNWRAKLGAWIFGFMFAAGFVGVLLLQVFDPQPPAQFRFLLGGYSLFVLMAVYFFGFVYSYRVEVTREGLMLYRFLISTRRLFWSDVNAFRFDPDGDAIQLLTDDGKKMGVYSSLNGLSAIRRCLAVFGRPEVLAASWSSDDAQIMVNVNAWRCSEADLQTPPFGAPLHR